MGCTGSKVLREELKHKELRLTCLEKEKEEAIRNVEIALDEAEKQRKKLECKVKLLEQVAAKAVVDAEDHKAAAKKHHLKAEAIKWELVRHLSGSGSPRVDGTWRIKDEVMQKSLSRSCCTSPTNTSAVSESPDPEVCMEKEGEKSSDEAENNAAQQMEELVNTDEPEEMVVPNMTDAVEATEKAAKEFEGDDKESDCSSLSELQSSKEVAENKVDVTETQVLNFVDIEESVEMEVETIHQLISVGHTIERKPSEKDIERITAGKLSSIEPETVIEDMSDTSSSTDNREVMSIYSESKRRKEKLEITEFD